MILKLTAVQPQSREESELYLDSKYILCWHPIELHHRPRTMIQTSVNVSYIVTQDLGVVTSMVMKARRLDNGEREEILEPLPSEPRPVPLIQAN